MLTDDGKHLYVSWDEYHLLTERLALKVHASGWEFDQILCLARGGMRPGDVLSRVFDKPLGIMSTSSYRAEAGTIQGRLDMAKYITLPKGELAGRVLLVDDLADSGVTLKAVVERLRGLPSITELRSAITLKCWLPARGSTSRSKSTTTCARMAWRRSCRSDAELSGSGCRKPAECGLFFVCAGPVFGGVAHRRNGFETVWRRSWSMEENRRTKTKRPAFSCWPCSNYLTFGYSWCPGEDSNLHGVTR
jgi:hypoxanthine phosphoribosyltransferase